MTPAESASALLAAWDGAARLDPAEFPVADPDAGLVIQDLLIALREARGERRLGYKIGFTNRSIWPLYGVHHPIWGPVWDRTVVPLSGTTTRLRPAVWSLPRLEPEIVLGLARSPRHADPDHVFECLAWVAHGVEIVTSPWPDWRFTAAQAIAAQGLHGGLHIGPPLSSREIAGPAALSALSLELSCNDQPVARGEGSAVLDGPVQALGHLVSELARRGDTLAPGCLVTTGTLTDAQALRAGDTWRTRLSGIALPGLEIVCEA